MPFLLSILAGVISSALWDWARDPLFGEAGLPLPDDNDPTWSDVVRAALSRAAPQLAEVTSPHQDDVAGFLQSTEVRNLVRQIYYTRSDQAGGTLAGARQTFVAIWGARYGHEIAEINAYSLFDALVYACEYFLDQALRRDPYLAAHEAKSAARHHVVTQRLDAIERQFHLLNSRDKRIDFSEIHDFMYRLRVATADRHATIFPPSLQGAREIPLDDLYVPPRLTIRGESSAVNYVTLLTRLQRLVVLGHPGAGKTTLLQKIALDLARHNSTGDPLGLTLVVVNLRRYAQDLRHTPIAIRDHVANLIPSQYQLQITSTSLEYLLLSGQVGVAFDGLDELPVISQRREIIKNIEAFSARYPQAPVLVTSRVVGYEHASLNQDRFATAYLEDFSARQVAEYAQKWFRLDERLGTPEADERAMSFTAESESVPDLRANPLLLGLMCNLYRGRGFIPRNRPEVYEKCATMLFEAWDAQRSIESLKPFEDLLRPTIRHLALWIYSDQELQVGVTEELVTRETQRFLAKWRFGDDLARAEHSAKGFIDFCRGRAWVFSDLGADPDDRAVFQFTHRTFLEFFAAEQVVQDHETTQELIDAILPHIECDEWEVVTQLVLQMQQRRHLGAADTILGSLLTNDKARSNRVSFCVRALQNVVPRPETVAAVTQALLNELACIYMSTIDPDDSYEILTSRLGELLRSDSENRDTIYRRIAETTTNWLKIPDRTECALELILNGEHIADDALGGASPTTMWWQEQFKMLAMDARHEILATAQEGGRAAAYYACKEGWLPWINCLKQYGPDYLWYIPNREIFTISSSFGERVICKMPLTEAKEITDMLTTLPPPWFSSADIEMSSSGPFFSVWKGETNFALRALLLAAVVEPALDAGYGRGGPKLSEQLLHTAESSAREAENSSRPSPLMVRIILSRGDEDMAQEVTESVRRRRFAKRSSHLLEQWMRGECKFVAG